MSVTVKFDLPRDYPDRILLVQRYKWWLADQCVVHGFVIEDEQHFPKSVIIEDEVDATAFKLKFGL